MLSTFVTLVGCCSEQDVFQMPCRTQAVAVVCSNTLRLSTKMKIRNYLYLLCFILTSCQQRTVYENNGETCKLTLYKDGTYKYKTPTFFGSSTESGNYKIINDKLILETKNFNNNDSVLNIEYFCANDTPSILKIRTLNSENDNVQTKIKLNKSDTAFVSSLKGEYSVNYKQLEKNAILEKGKNIDLFTITFNNKEYTVDMLKDYPNSRKPEELVFKLNDFAGQEFRPLIRKYEINNDTIYINDISRKLTGFPNFKLIKK